MKLKTKIRWWFQRRIRGWDDRELWDLDHKIAEFVLPRLQKFRMELDGHPTGFTSIEEWDKVLDKIEKSMLAVARPWEVRPHTWPERVEWAKGVQEGFELFGKHFQKLWN
jgi:hypothetical protein